MLKIRRDELVRGNMYLFFFRELLDRSKKSMYIIQFDRDIDSSNHPFTGNALCKCQSDRRYVAYRSFNTAIKVYQDRMIGLTTLHKDAEIFELTDDEVENIVAYNI